MMPESRFLLTLPERQARFSRICTDTMKEAHTAGEAGIGTLREKRMHSIIKKYLCEDTDFHEVGIANTRYVSDVRVGDEIFEVQTGSFYPMYKKNEHYLKNTECTVTVVHPMAAVKWVMWLNPENGEVVKRNRSPKKETAFSLLPELDSLKDLFPHPRLRFRILFLEVQDFRMLNGRSKNRKRGAEKYETIPLALLDEKMYCTKADFRELIPPELPAHFTVKQFSALSKVYGRDAYFAVRALCSCGLVSPAEPIGRSRGFCLSASDIALR